MDDTFGLLVADCSVGNQGSVVYDFSGVSISVPSNKLFLPLSDYGMSDNNNLCGLGILPTSGPYNIILGDTFLRSAYAVYDLENFQIALAKTNFNAANSNVQALSSGIPSASTDASCSSTDLASNFQFSSGLFSVTGSGGASGIETSMSQGSVITITPCSLFLLKSVALLPYNILQILRLLGMATVQLVPSRHLQCNWCVYWHYQ